MATDPLLSDPLLSLRRAIAAQALPTPTTSSDVSNASENATDDLAKASYLYFSHPLPHTIPLNTLTRFVSTANNDTQVDLRSIFFAWQKKDVAIPEYIASAQEVNEALKQRETGNDEQVLNLVFVERLDLITWLEGASDDSEYIKPLEGAAAAAAAAADVTAPAATIDAAAVAKPAVPTSATGVASGGSRPTKVIDPQLQEIYNGERKLGDRNTVLRGIKPTDFSHIRKTAEIFLGRSRSSRGQYPPGSNKAGPGKGGIIVPAPSAGLALPKKPGPSSSSSSGSSRRPDPIILLSPSASSPIRLSNIKTFLQDGVFVPPDHPTLATHTTSNMQIITRQLRLGNDAAPAGSKASGGSGGGGLGASQSSRKPTRFILADSTANFKPDYWQRLVAVFTTGQAWQFKTYKWSNPPELFRHAAGIYVGMAGEHVPNQIKDWGRGVDTFTLARWDEKKGVDGAGRWLDREIVEHIWDVIENNMKAKGWTK